jgi:hypothetical protein
MANKEMTRRKIQMRKKIWRMRMRQAEENVHKEKMRY